MPDFHVAFTEAPESIPPSKVTFDRPLPRGLSGAFLRNGPGIQHVGGRKQHFFDGYGFIAALRIEGGTATLNARHAETGVWKKERAAGKQAMRKPFTNLPGGRLANLFKLNLANTAMHDVYMWGGSVVVKELGADWKPVHEVTGTISGPGSFLHDLAFSPNWVAMAEFGRLNPIKAVAGAATVYDALDPGSKALRLVLFDRKSGGKAHELVVPHPKQAYHLPNMWEDGDAVELLAITYDCFLDFRGGYPPGMERPGPLEHTSLPTMVKHRYVPRTKQHTFAPVDAPRLEAPCVNPDFFGRKNRFVWGPTPGTRGDEEDATAYFWYHGITRVDLVSGKHQVFDFGPRTYVSPPAFANKPGGVDEDEGWLLVWINDAEKQKSGVVVFEAAAVDKGPIARADFDLLLPAVSHCEFVESQGKL